MSTVIPRLSKALSGQALLLLTVFSLAGCGERPDKLVASAHQYIDRQDYPGAIIQLKNALKAKPDYAEARYLLGFSLLKAQDPVSAEKELRRAIDLGYSAEEAQPVLAQTLLSQGKASEVISEFGSTTLSAQDAEASLQTQLGNAYLALGKVGEAQASFDKALMVKPGDAPARVGQARVLAVKGHLDEAITILDQVLAASPREAGALTLKANIVLSQGKLDEAIGLLTQVTQIQPGVAAEYSLGMVLVHKGDTDQAARQVESMKRLAAKDPRTIHLEALIAFKQRNFSRARDLALQLLKVAPDHLPSLMLAAASSYELGAYAQAQEHLRKVLGESPRFLYAKKLLVASYVRTQETDRASRLLDDALKQAPHDPELLMFAGELAMQKKQFAVAASFYEQAEKYGANPARAGPRLAQTLAATGDIDKAVKVLESASASDDRQFESDLLLSRYYLSRGETAKALSWIDSIEKKQPQAATAPTLRGVVYLQKKDYAAARRELETALTRNGAFVPALTALSQLDRIEKRPDVAKKRFEDALKKSPGNEGLALAYVGFLRSSGGSFAEIDAVLRRTIQTEPGAVRARGALIVTYLEQKDYRQALVAAQEGLAVAPNDLDLLVLAGKAQLAVGDANQAVASFEKLTSLQPQAAGPLLLLAQAHLDNGDKMKAMAALKRALELKPDLLPAQTALIGLYVAEKQTNEALSVARTMQKQQPKAEAGYLAEARILVAANRLQDSLEVLEKGLRATSSPSMIPRLHKTLVALGRESDADQLITKWLKDHPKDVVVRVYLAERATQEKKYESAARWYKELLTMRPDAPMVLNNLAWVAGQTGDPKAVEYAEHANALSPNTPGIEDTLGWLLVEKGEVSRGVQLLQRAVEGAPGDINIRLHLAKALIRAQQNDAAKKELQYVVSNAKTVDVKTEAETLLKQL